MHLNPKVEEKISAARILLCKAKAKKEALELSAKLLDGYNYRHFRMFVENRKGRGFLLNNGGATVAWKWKLNNIEVAVTICSYHDCFNKVKGRSNCNKLLTGEEYWTKGLYSFSVPTVDGIYSINHHNNPTIDALIESVLLNCINFQVMKIYKDSKKANRMLNMIYMGVSIKERIRSGAAIRASCR